jgi:ABC-2 type transport system ATP-binding protein
VNQPVITVRNLQKRYKDGKFAVRGIGFDVQKGEIFGLLGPNGAGKTTTMKILGTLHNATAGNATVLGLDVAKNAPAIRRRIGFAMQEVGMDDLATALEMMMFHASLYHIPKAQAAARSEELLKTFDLWDDRKRRVTSFSGGMQRRLDLAVSLLHNPEVLFLDEPTTGLDPTSRAELWNLLRTLRRDHGLTIFMSTHYMEEADELCDRLAIMHDGEIAAIDTVDALKRSMGADVIEVKLVAAPSAQQREAVAKTFGKNGRFIDHSLHISVADGSASLLPAMRALDRIGLQIGGTKVKTPTLDDVFLRYTGARLATEVEA